MVKFDSNAGTLTMFGDVALQFLKLMGHSGTIPSAIKADDVPAALAKLESALGAQPAEGAPKKKSGDDREPEPVSLRQRAFPLVQLFKRAAEKHCDVMWDRA